MNCAYVSSIPQNCLLNCFTKYSFQVANDEKPCAEPQSIFLEGSLPHDSQILVADSETKTETVFDDDLDDNKDEPAVSDKFFFLLISLKP